MQSEVGDAGGIGPRGLMRCNEERVCREDVQTQPVPSCPGSAYTGVPGPPRTWSHQRDSVPPDMGPEFVLDGPCKPQWAPARYI